MRRRVAAAGLAAAMAAMVIVPQQADAVAAAILYVNKMSAFCSDTSSTAGASATPFCTIQAAADAARAGDTVEIFGGAANAVAYPGSFTVTHSGTAAAPISFESVGRYVQVGDYPLTAVTVDGASHVDLIGLDAEAVDIEDSAYVNLSRSSVEYVNVEKGSSSVSVERDDLDSATVASGVSDTDIAVDIIHAGAMAAGGVSVVGAVGTDIVNNSFDIAQYSQDDFAGISVTGGATGTGIENNILWGTPGGLPELLVDKSSAAGTTEGYNVLGNGASTSAPYSWAGSSYTTASGFQAASGQGTADVLDDSFKDFTTSALLTSEDPAVGSANSAAPGLPSTDYYGNPWTDDTAVASTGAGPETYYDRGAVNLAEYTGAALETTVDQQSVEVNIDVAGLVLGWASVTLDWGDGSATDTVLTGSASTLFTDFSDNTELHQYTSVGTYTVTVTVADVSGTKTFTTEVTTGGSTYVPVTPTRVLDTRTGLGDGAAGTVAAGRSVAFNVVNGVSGAPSASEITAVVLNVTVTQPVAGGFVSAFPDGTVVPKSSNVNYGKGETVPNLTTVLVGQDGKVDLYTSAATHLVADVEGYYVASTSSGGYDPISPVRLLDTRKGIGAAAQAVGPGKSIVLRVAGNGAIPSSGVIAAALNVTVTGSSANGVITVFPAGGGTPNASNVNYGKGETVANMAIVKLGSGGEIEFTNGSKGAVQIIADISGYYTANGGDAFVPMAPWRGLDTRNATGQENATGYPAGPDSSAIWFFNDEFEGSGYWSGDSHAAALVLNVTVTEPTASGYVVAAAADESLPASSNIDFSAGETVPSMVMAACDTYGDPILVNESKGATQLVADVFGYFS